MSKRKRKLHEIPKEEDIRYRGPISYQGFQALGWLCITVAAVILMIRVAGKLSPEIAENTTGLLGALSYIRELSLPFLLIANFSKILNNSEGYRKQLIRNGGVAAAIFLVSFFLFGRYVIGSLGLFVTDPENVAPTMESAFRQIQPAGFVAFNMFIDLFLCTLFMFFLNARPKKVFTGKKLMIFRLLAILPVAYEVFSFVLKGLSAVGKTVLPLWSFPLLTVKPPMTFLVFVTLALYIKRRERHFRKHGKTHEDYEAFLKTNRNSLQFSIFLSVTLVIAAIVDFIILFVLTLNYAPSAESIASATAEIIKKYAFVSIAMGFGESTSLIFIAPIVLLFSYTRIPKHKVISLLIPVIAIVLMLLILLEGTHQGLGIYSGTVKKMSLQQLIEMISMSIGR